MELDLGPEIEQFRHEPREWIAEHAPPVLVLGLPEEPKANTRAST